MKLSKMSIFQKCRIYNIRIYLETYQYSVLKQSSNSSHKKWTKRKGIGKS